MNNEPAKNELAYFQYWQRKKLLRSSLPEFRLVRWWGAQDLCEIECIYFDALKSAQSVLDIGAGDLRMRDKFVRAGFAGEYHTMDVGTEFVYTYASVQEINRQYEAIVCLDVLEHLPLEDGLSLLWQMAKLLLPGGRLIVQTPNARCIRNPLAWDMTHLKIYNVTDLWAYLTVMGLETKGYRVWFVPPSAGVTGRIRTLISRFVVTRILGSDYADNIALIAVNR